MLYFQPCMHSQGANTTSRPDTGQMCMRLGLHTVVAEVEKLQSAFMHAIDSEDTKILDQVRTIYTC